MRVYLFDFVRHASDVLSREGIKTYNKLWHHDSCIYIRVSQHTKAMYVGKTSNKGGLFERACQENLEVVAHQKGQCKCNRSYMSGYL